jgi:spore germination cell wall hydrolase CwlJ-like protein
MNHTKIIAATLALTLVGCAEKKEPPLKREVSGKITQAAQAKIIKTSKKLSLSKQDFHCLAKNVYHEAGVEPFAGKVAVAQITLNRLKTGRWGKSVCDVVYSKAQFSWTLNRKLKYSEPKGKLWEDSIAAVNEVAKGIRVKSLDTSLWYHANYISQPKWANMDKVVQVINKHIFYGV